MKKIVTPIFIFLAYSVFAQNADSANFYFAKAMEEKAASKHLLVVKNLDKAIAFNKDLKEAYIESGLANLQMRNLGAALNNFEKTLELDPQNQIATKELLNLYFSFKKYQKAIDFAAKCTQCEQAERVVALSYYGDENYVMAEKALSTYLTKNSTDAEASFALARTYLELENEKKAIEYYENALKNDPKRGSWYSELGLIYYNNNQFKKAIDCFNNAVANGITQSNDFRENLGFAYIYAGDTSHSEPILKDLIRRKSGNKEIIRDVAEAYYTSKQYDMSLKYCQQLLEMDAKDGKALYQAGLCFQKKGEKDRGQKMCDVAIQMDPSLGKMRRQQSLPAGL